MSDRDTFSYVYCEPCKNKAIDLSPEQAERSGAGGAGKEGATSKSSWTCVWGSPPRPRTGGSRRKAPSQHSIQQKHHLTGGQCHYCLPFPFVHIWTCSGGGGREGRQRTTNPACPEHGTAPPPSSSTATLQEQSSTFAQALRCGPGSSSCWEGAKPGTVMRADQAKAGSRGKGVAVLPGVTLGFPLRAFPVHRRLFLGRPRCGHSTSARWALKSLRGKPQCLPASLRPLKLSGPGGEAVAGGCLGRGSSGVRRVLQLQDKLASFHFSPLGGTQSKPTVIKTYCP